MPRTEQLLCLSGTYMLRYEEFQCYYVLKSLNVPNRVLERDLNFYE